MFHTTNSLPECRRANDNKVAACKQWRATRPPRPDHHVIVDSLSSTSHTMIIYMYTYKIIEISYKL